MLLVKLLDAADGIMSIKTHLKGAFVFNGFLDVVFFFIGKISHDVQKGSGSILSSISFQTLAVSPAINDLVDLYPNRWYDNYKAIFFLGANFFVFDISFLYPKNTCLLCELCGKVTAFFSLFTKYTVQNPLRNKQVCP